MYYICWVILFSSAKINIGLNVLNKRKDGFHNIETCMFPIPLFDIIELLPSDKFTFKQTGIKIDSPIKDNLCVRAYHLIKKNYDIEPVYIHLQKNIPMGAGLGGGSSNAAFVLKGLNSMFDLKISKSELLEMASFLGSDCPFFIDSIPALCFSRGELMESICINLTGFYIKLIYPAIHVSTKLAYAGIKCNEIDKQLKKSILKDKRSWKNEISNSFEKNVFLKNPILSKIKNELYADGAIYASMSGSGSSIYGLFDKEPLKSREYPANVMEFIFSLSTKQNMI